LYDKQLILELDVMVSKLNSDRKAGESAIQAVSRIYSKIGVKGLFNGLGVRIIMIGTLTGSQFMIYDSFKVFLGVSIQSFQLPMIHTDEFVVTYHRRTLSNFSSDSKSSLAVFGVCLTAVSEMTLTDGPVDPIVSQSVCNLFNVRLINHPWILISILTENEILSVISSALSVTLTDPNDKNEKMIYRVSCLSFQIYMSDCLRFPSALLHFRHPIHQFRHRVDSRAVPEALDPPTLCDLEVSRDW